LDRFADKELVPITMEELNDEDFLDQNFVAECYQMNWDFLFKIKHLSEFDNILNDKKKGKGKRKK
jgi:hypothetical protein